MTTKTRVDNMMSNMTPRELARSALIRLRDACGEPEESEAMQTWRRDFPRLERAVGSMNHAQHTEFKATLDDAGHVTALSMQGSSVVNLSRLVVTGAGLATLVLEDQAWLLHDVTNLVDLVKCYSEETNRKEKAGWKEMIDRCLAKLDGKVEAAEKEVDATLDQLHVVAAGMRERTREHAQELLDAEKVAVEKLGGDITLIPDKYRERVTDALQFLDDTTEFCDNRPKAVFARFREKRQLE